MSWSSGLKILLLCLIIPSFVLLTLLNFTNVGIVRINHLEEKGSITFTTHHVIFKMNEDNTSSDEFLLSNCNNQPNVNENNNTNDDDDDASNSNPDTFCRLHTNFMQYITAAFILTIFVLSALVVFLFIVRKTITVFDKKEIIGFFCVVIISVGSLITNILLFAQVGVYKAESIDAVFTFQREDDESIKDPLKGSYVPSIMTYTGFPLVLQSCMLLTLLLFYFKVVMNAQGYEQFGRA